MRILFRVTSAIAAAAVMAGILVGLPIALWMLTEPVIARVLAADPSLVDVLVRPDDGTLLMGFLALVAACAWLVLAVSIIGELATALTHRPVPRIDLPGFRLGRSIAVALVAALLGSGTAIAAPSAALGVVAPNPVESDHVPSGYSEIAPVTVDSQPPGPEYVVAPRDTLWRIAETALGDPLRWREIYDLNVGRVQADGNRLSEASLLGVGWRLVMPADAREIVRVEPDDTLTGLAAEHLGDPARAHELFEANVTLRQPGGEALTDPDLLRPGWALALPEPPAQADLPSPSTSLPPPAAGTTAPPLPAPVLPGINDARPGSAPTASPGTPPPTPGPAAPVGSGEASEAGPELMIAAMGVSSVVLGGVLTALAVRRRRQLRHRPFRHRIAVPADEPGRVEWSAARAEPSTTTHHLDLALRSLTHPEREGITVPALRSVRLTSTDALVTLVGSTSLPAPFVAVGAPGEWGLDADDPLPVPAEEAKGCCAPFPTLVSVATDDDRTLMIDLEQRGVLRIDGHRGRCIALLRHIAAELATNRTAEDTEVLLVGLGEELPALNPEQLHVMPDLNTALIEIEHRIAITRDALERLDVRSAVEGRLRNVAADSWLPTVLLVGQEPAEQDRARLEALADAEPGVAAVAVVVLDTLDSELRVGDDGLLELPDVNDGPWQAVQLTENAGTHLAAVLGTTADPAIPAGPATATESWAAGMDEDGSLGPEEAADSHDDDEVEDDDEDDVGPGLVVPHRHEQQVNAEAVRRLAIVDHQDPRLDDDLAAWHDTQPPEVPMIAILGEPTVRAPGTVPRARPSWFAEVLVYLSLHPAGVTAAKAATDLWPDGHRISPATVRHAFYGARRWAGRGLGGNPDTPFVSDMQNDSTYRLRGHLLDWDLFRRLRKRGQARHEAGHPDAIADYEAALALIRGPVLSALRPGGYAWLNNHDQRHDLQIPGFIIDTAHELVDIALATGDIGLARRAAEQARTVDVDVAFDRPLTDLMRIAYAEDNRSELELYAAVLLDARGFDVPEELAPDSFAVLNELLPAGPRRPRQ
ncbi:BTAD domain-containing putative transcriptional regulator [Pseudonocardia sp.]|uniref:BTAD domain-containing putative transcriptional regulator n=1 Tax=Pseudonocardia sp. TaxID=60912 RepID=UPI003D0C3DD3